MQHEILTFMENIKTSLCHPQVALDIDTYYYCQEGKNIVLREKENKCEFLLFN